MFCTVFDKHVWMSYCGWFEKLQPRDAAVIVEVASFRQISKHLLPFSPFYNIYDGRMTANKQVRVDSIGA